MSILGKGSMRDKGKVPEKSCESLLSASMSNMAYCFFHLEIQSESDSQSVVQHKGK
ncbi:hypothetical protein NQZ68_002763 [Dissostichus eleginoides]|nr:hypothetical protein NQZ68_002763 [Dissostichus eleginoides]